MSAYCTECGKKNDDNRSYCGACGAKLPESVQTAKQGQAIPKIDLSFWSRWSKKTKVLLIASVSFVILCLVLFQTGKFLTDQERLINQFEAAIETEDIAFLQAKLKTLTEGEELNAEQSKDLIQYMKQDSTTLEEVLDSLKNNANQLVIDDEQVGSSSPLHHLVNLRNNGKFLWLFDQYELVLKPVYVSLYSNYPEADLLLNGDVIAEHLIHRDGDEMIIGPLIPGNYVIQGEMNTDYIQVNSESSVQAFQDVSEQLMFDIQTIEIRSPYPNTKLYANGTDTGTVLNNEEISFGPVTLDQTLELHGIAETPFGQLISDSVYVDGSWVGLEFSNYDDVIPAVMADANKFILSWYKVLNTVEPSYLTNATKDYNDAMFDNFKNMKNYYDIEREFVKQTWYGVDNLIVSRNNGAWEADIPVSITTNVEKYSDLALQLTLIYSESEKEWQVDQLYSIGDVNSSEIKEHSFDIADQEANTPQAKVLLDAEYLISNYLYDLVSAINSNSFNYVESSLVPDSELYKSQKDLVERLYNDGIYEEVVSYTVKSSEPLNDGNDAYKIRVTETIRIYKDSGDEDRTYEWWYYSKPYNDEQRLYKIEKVE